MSKTITSEQIAGTNDFLVIIHESAAGGFHKQVSDFERVSAEKLEEATERLKTKHGIDKHVLLHLPHLPKKSDKANNAPTNGRN